MVLGRLKLVPEGVELRPWRSLEVRGSPELQKGGLRDLEEAWDDFLIEALETGGKPSTRLPPGKLVEHLAENLSSSRQPTAFSLQPVV